MRQEIEVRIKYMEEEVEHRIKTIKEIISKAILRKSIKNNNTKHQTDFSA